MIRSNLISAAIMMSLSQTLAETASFTSSADTSISARDPNNNFGGDTHASAGRDGNSGGNVRRTLLLFDIGAIPAGSTINSATLNLSVVITPIGGGVNSSFELHRLTLPWVEGNKTGNNGSSASSDEVTWNNRAHNTTPWSGGLGAEGDYELNASASTAVAGNGSYRWSSAQLTADVQNWLNNPNQNFGWLLLSDNEVNNFTVRAFGTREATSDDHPSLEIDYTPPPQMPEDVPIEVFTANNDTVSITWNTITNQTYDVLYRRSFNETEAWNVAEAHIETPAESIEWTDVPLLAGPLYNGNTSMFYRVKGRPASPPLEISFDIVASGLTSPVMATHAGDGSGRLFVVQQTGEILIIDDSGTLLPTPFLDVSSAMVSINSGYDERGLLGLAFHPDYENNGRFFVHYSAPPSDGSHNNLTTIAEYSVSGADSNVADSASAQILLQVPQPQANHAGGTLTFGPDGYLYLGLGDGGGGGDQHGTYGNGQDTSNLLGSIIRIDVDSEAPYAIPPDNPFTGMTGYAPEIFAYGFRNPYRFSFDRGGTHALFVADVGQALWEEIDIVGKGENHGWRIAEGGFAYDLAVADSLGIDLGSLAYPIHNYPHNAGLGNAVVGGFVYHGSAYPELVGKYVFGDYDQHLYYLEETSPGIWQRFEFSIHPEGGSLGRYIKGFGEDEAGEIHVCSDSSPSPAGTGGDVRKLVKP